MKFEILESENVFAGFLRLCRRRLRHESYHGGWCPEIVRERLEHLSAASVLMYDPLRDQVVLVEQFRVGALEDPHGPWLLETAGGYRPPGEAAADVARREALEEAACELGELVHIGDFYVSPGLSSERIALYCGRVDAARAHGIHGLEHEGEESRVVVLPFTDAHAQLFKRINSTSVIIAIQWLAAERDRLRRRWSDAMLSPAP
jgi:ADP-ribose pyrophosphatase